MRKALGSAALAAMLSMGIGTASVAHAAAPVAQAEMEDDAEDEESWFEENGGLLGLIGLVGLAGLARGGGGGGRGGGGRGSGTAGRPYVPPTRKGGYTTDWSQRR